MKFENGISNPMLVGMIELMKEEDTPERREMFVQEMMRATFISPVMIDPPPVKGEDGVNRIPAGSKVSFPLIHSKKGEKYFMAFTDIDELKLYQKEENPNVFALKFEDYVSMLLREDDMGRKSEAMGIVINPMSSNIIMLKDTIANLMLAKLAKEQGINPARYKKDVETLKAMDEEIAAGKKAEE